MVYLSPFLWIGTTLAFFYSSGNLPFRRHFLKINSRDLQIESPQSFNIRILIISWLWALFESSFPIIWRMSLLEKLHLNNEFSVGKVNCDGNTLLLRMREHCLAKKVKISLFFKINDMLVMMKCRWNTSYFLSF